MTKKKILAVSSSGGHWIELLRLRPAFAGHDVVFVTTQKDGQHQAKNHKIYTIPDAHKGAWLRLAWLAFGVMMIVLIERPDVVISTGAAPGYFALRFGRWVRARTLWLDSLANAETLSLSGKIVQPYADLLLTQWPHLATGDGHSSGPICCGDVL